MINLTVIDTDDILIGITPEQPIVLEVSNIPPSGDPVGTAANLINQHISAINPHTQYPLKTQTINGQALSGNITLTKSDIGLTNVDNTSDANKPVSNSQQTALDLKADLTDTRFTDSRTPIGTAGGVLSGSYPNPGFAQDMATQSELDNHITNNANPHGVTKTQVGLGNVDNTADVNKPISTAQQAGLDLKQSISEKNQPNGYAGLDTNGLIPSGNLPAIGNTDVVSEGTTNLYFTQGRVLTTLLTGLSAGTAAIIVAGDNLLQSLAKLQAQLLTKIDNTDTRLTNSRTPIGGAGGVLSGSYPNPGFAQDMATQSELDSHIANNTNPHGVTKTQVGLGNVDNTSDINKPISTAQQAGLDLKQSISEKNQPNGYAGLDSNGNLSAISNTDVIPEGTTNLYFTPGRVLTTLLTGLTTGTATVIATGDSLLQSLAKLQAQLLAKVDNTDTRLTDSRIPTGIAGGVLSGSYPNPGFAQDMATQSELDSHIADNTNPHGVTKIQVGLGNVDNTSDVNKPISTAQQAGLDLKQSISEKNQPNGYAGLDTNGLISSGNLPAIGNTDVVSEGTTNLYFTQGRVLTTLLTGLTTGTATVIATGDSLLQSLAKLQAQLLAKVDNTDTRLTDSRAPIGIAGGVLSGSYPNPGFAQDMATQSELNNHIADNANPHGVTKIQVGLGNVDNTSDINKPISTAQQAGLDLKQSISEKNQPNGYAGLDTNGLIPTINLPKDKAKVYAIALGG